VVSNGAKVSPGDVVLIDSEQELVEATGAVTDSTANTAEALDASEEEVDVNDGTQVNAGEVIRVNFEQMRVLDIATNTLLVNRGYNGTKRTTHDTAATHSSDTIYRYLPPYDVGYLCRQMAALMLKKAQSGFAGKVGSVELGEVFYMQEFPKEVLDRVIREYAKARRLGG
jgi:hypothetical protein